MSEPYSIARAVKVLRLLDIQIDELGDKIGVLKDNKAVTVDLLLTYHGSCPHCQNGHWPHCRK